MIPAHFVVSASTYCWSWAPDRRSGATTMSPRPSGGLPGGSPSKTRICVPNVQRPKPGARLTGSRPSAWVAALCTTPRAATRHSISAIILRPLRSAQSRGTYAEFVKVPANTVQIVPDTLDFITAAVVGRHGPLAFTQLRDRAQLENLGEWVLVMGAAGGLGSALVQAAGRSIWVRASLRRPAATHALQPPSNWERIGESTTGVRT